VTIVEPPEPPAPTPETRLQHRHDVALWAAFAAFFGNIVGLEVLDRITDSDVVAVLEGLIVSLFVAGAVYSRERLLDAKRDAPPPPE
jgi:hypothetical protein